MTSPQIPSVNPARRFRARGTLRETSDQSDSDLVAAALRDPNAYAALVRRYEKPLSRYLKRVLGTHGQYAEDVLQEAFLKAYINLRDYDQSRPFSPWIYRIAYNEAISSLRKRRHDPALIAGDDGANILEQLAGSDNVQENHERARNEVMLGRAIAKLEPRYRDVIVLRFLEEKSYDEIGEILRIPPGTVATLISRGQERLRRAINELAGKA